LNEAFQLTNPQAATVLGRQIFNNWKSRDLTAANAWANANPQAAQLLQPAR
jgi:hypothetical protein